MEVGNGSETLFLMCEGVLEVAFCAWGPSHGSAAPRVFESSSLGNGEGTIAPYRHCRQQ